MPLSLDGFDVLKRMAAHRDLFETVKAESADAAEALVRRVLMSSSTDLAKFREIIGALGEDTVELVLQTMDVSDVRTLLQRIDVDRSRSDPRRHTTATRRLLKAVQDRAEPPKPPRRRSLKAVLEPLETRPFATLSMAPNPEDWSAPVKPD